MHLLLFSRRYFPWLVLFILIVSATRGLQYFPQELGDPYVFIDYSSGFFKRGLVGTIIKALFYGADAARLKSAFTAIHLVLCCATLWMVALLWKYTLQARGDALDRGLWLVMIVVASSQFWPTLFFNVGYLDVYLYFMFTLSLVALHRGQTGVAVAIAVVAPVLHESAAFVWLPLMVLTAWESWRNKRLEPQKTKVILALLVASGLVVLFHNNEAAIRELNAAPLSDRIKGLMIRNQMGQTLGSAFRYHVELWTGYTWHALFSSVFFTLPTFAALGVYFNLRKITLCEALTMCVAVLAPVSILIIACDLSRFLVFTNFTALLVILYWETKYMPAIRPLRFVEWAVAPLILYGLLTPFVFAYFENAYVYDNGILPATNNWVGKETKNFFTQVYSQPPTAAALP